MALNIKIINYYEGNFPFNFEKKIIKLIKKTPLEYIEGLEFIIIVNEINKNKKILASYNPETKNEKAFIKIAFDSLYLKYPKIVFYIPIIWEFTIGSILFKEFGKHIQYKDKNIIKSKELEKNAIYNKNILLNKVLWKYLIFLKPFKTIIVNSIKKNNSKKNL